MTEPDDDERRVDLLRDLDDVLAVLEEGVRGSDVDGKSCGIELRSEFGEVGLDRGGGGVVAFPGQVDDEQGELPEQRLVAGVPQGRVSFRCRHEADDDRTGGDGRVHGGSFQAGG